MQEMDQLASSQGLPTYANTLNKLMALHHGLNNQTSNHHVMVSRGIKSHMTECGACGLVFSSKDDLAKHMSLVHENFDKFVCFNCGNFFDKEGGVVTHGKSVHKEEYEGKFVCHSCSHIFIKTWDLSDHGCSGESANRGI